ncbi:hypothetical protein BDV95DRAFT_477832, partial [Massariosphaeria phaeospora]
DEDQDDMAAQMGFSAFGSTKKRKYGQTTVDSPRSKTDGSGANTTQLGARPKAAPAEDMQECRHPPINIGDEASTLQTHSLSSAPKDKQLQSAATGLSAFLARGQALPHKHPDAQQHANSPVGEGQAVMVSFGGPPISRAKLSALKMGVLNEDGDSAYFLPSFVQDPWEK